MDQSESMNVDSTDDSSSVPQEKQTQNTGEDQSSTKEDQSNTEKDSDTQEKDQSSTEKDQGSTTEKDQGTEEDQNNTEKDQGSTEKDPCITEKDQDSTTEKDQGTTEEDQNNTEKDQGSTEKDQSNTGKDSNATEKDQSTIEDQSNTEMDQGTTEEDQGTTEKDQGTIEEDQGTTEKDQDTIEEDQGTTEKDQGTTEEDQGTTEKDQGSTEKDQSNTVKDSDATEKDQSTIEEDQSNTEMDQGTTEEDQGTTEKDQGTIEEDQGTTEKDQGTIEEDQGTTEKDHDTTEEDQDNNTDPLENETQNAVENEADVEMDVQDVTMESDNLGGDVNMESDNLEGDVNMESDNLEGDTNEGSKEDGREKPCSNTADDSETPIPNMAVVIMDEDFLSQSDILDVDKSTSDKQSNQAENSQEGGSDEVTNPLAASEQENADKPDSESDIQEIMSEEETPSMESSGNRNISQTSKTKENNNSSDKQRDKSGTSGTDEGQEKASEGLGNNDTSTDIQAVQEIIVENDENDSNKLDDSEDIVELPVHKEPTMIVDLAEEDDAGKNPNEKQNENAIEESEDNSTTSEGKKIKLRSLASLVDISNGEEAPANPVVSTSHPDLPGIGEIVEHGVIIGSDEMDGLQLRISNVVGGEDCITGLTVDEDRDAFSSIQISSVTTLINPISPEDPNQVNDGNEKSKDDEDNEMDTSEVAASVSESTNTTVNSSAPCETNNLEAVEGDGAVSASVVGSLGKSRKAAKNSESSSNKVSKSSDGKKSDDSTESPKIRLSSAVSEIAKDTGSTEKSDPPRHVYHVLRSILTVKRECIICCKNAQCEFRIVKKGENGTWAFLCSTFCRTQWNTSLPPNHVVEKPRLIFEKLCGMCGKDLANVTRDGQYSWETREFCSKDCLTQHLNEVAGMCHMCNEKVRISFIGKYCVRFGSDIHQFCSNTCLECYKTKIKVCCYCQKNLENVTKVTSVSNKEYCSVKCLKRAQRRDIGQQNYSDQNPCTVCQTLNLNRYEFVSKEESIQLCSDPCLNVYKYANRVKAVPCCLCFRVMNAEDVSHYLYHGGHQLRVFCSDSCVNVFILSARKIVVCDICKVKKYNFDMVHRQVDEDFRDYFYCSLDCLNSKEATSGNKSKNGVSSSSGSGTVTSSNSSDPPITNCNMCSAMAKAQYHMVMSDNTLRSFCRYACATKYKNTFGFQVNGIQSSTATQTNTATTPILRDKLQKQADSQPEESENTTQTKKKSICDSIDDVDSVTAELLKILAPPTMVNKMTSCRPATVTKGVYCKPQPWHRGTQTETTESQTTTTTATTPTKKHPLVLPVPVPIYVPAPMMMYNMPYPVPVVVPIPLPVPIFIPTTAKTTENIAKTMNKIQEEMPEDPYEAEMLLLAAASSASAEAEAAEAAETTVEETPENPAVASDNESQGEIDELQDVDVSCLDTLEEDIPRYPLKDIDIEASNHSPVQVDSNSEGEEDDDSKKRKRKDDDEDYIPRKKICQSIKSPKPLPAPDPEVELEPPTSPALSIEQIGDDYPSPYLNKLYGLAAWKKWVTRKNAELSKVSSSRSMKMISDDLLTMNCEELNYALCLFLKDLRKDDDESYQPDTVFYLLLGIQQHLFDSARTDCIFMDFGFEKFTNSFDEITKTFVSRTMESDVGSTSDLGVTRITEAMLWECRQLGAHTPQVLLNTLFYFNTKIFKFKTVEEHQAMAFSQLVKQWRRTVVDPEGSVMRTTLLKYFTPKKDGQKRQIQEMHENREDPLRCPVKLYEFYLSKCPESLRNKPDIYYVYPERSCVPDSPTWFSNQAVQPASLSKMLHRALMVREVQEALLD